MSAVDEQQEEWVSINYDDLGDNHDLAAEAVLDNNLTNAAFWYLNCAKICIRNLGGEDIIVADVLEAMQRFMASVSCERFAEDRALLMSVIERYCRSQ